MGSRETKLPPLNERIPVAWDGGTRGILKGVVETLGVLTARRGDELDQAVTWRKLIDNGIVTRVVDGQALPVDPALNTVIGGYGTPPTVYGLPVAPTNVLVVANFHVAFVEWDKATYLGHAYTEVWRSNDSNINNASLIGSTIASFYQDNINSGQNYWYWVRHVNSNSPPQFSPWADVAGHQVTTAIDPADVAAELIGIMSESHLVTALNSRIDIIDTSGGLFGSGLVTDVTTLGGDITALQTTVNDETLGVLANATAIETLDEQVTTADGLITAHAGSITFLNTSMTFVKGVLIPGDIGLGGFGNIKFTKNKNNAGTSDDGEIRVEGTAFYHPDGIKRTVVASKQISTNFEGAVTGSFFIIFSDQDPELRFTGLSFGANDSEDFFLAVHDETNGWRAKDNAGTYEAVTVLDTDLVVAVGDKTSGSGGIDRLTSLIATNTNMPADGADVTATATAFTELETEVSTTQDGVVANASDITALEATVSDVSDQLLATALAVSGTSATVSIQGDAITATASNLTTLQATVGGHTSSIEVQAEAIVSMEDDVVDLEAEYMVKLDVDGKVSGFGLVSDASSSEFVIKANKFALYDDDATGFELAFPFIVGPVDGVQRISLNAATYIQDATIGAAAIDSAVITNAHIEEGTINTANIGDAQVTNAKIGNTIQSDAWNPTTKAGWKIDKAGNIDAGSITIWNGTTVVMTSGTLYYADGSTTIDSLKPNESGATSNTLLSGTAVPTTEGSDGDFYRRTTDNSLYQKVSGTWHKAADTTLNNVAASVTGQGNLATQNTVNVGTEVTGTLGTSNAASGLLNSSVSISSDGALSGAGGGTVTIGGLGYTGDLAATENVLTTSASDPTGGSDGDLHYNTTSKSWWAKISGSWAMRGDITLNNVAASVTGQTGFATLSQITSANISTYIASLAVDTLQIAGNAVTIPTTAFTETWTSAIGTTSTEIQTLTYTSTGANTEVHFSVRVKPASGTVLRPILGVYRDDSVLHSIPQEINTTTGGSAQGVMNYTFMDTPTSGSRTYSIKASKQGGVDLTFGDIYLRCLEVKK